MTDWIHRVLDEYIKEGDCCIDATMGKGGDTYYLCSKTGESGKVYAFDVQADALRQTRENWDKHKMNAELILDGHEHMKEYVKRNGSILVLCSISGIFQAGTIILQQRPTRRFRQLKQDWDAKDRWDYEHLCLQWR